MSETEIKTALEAIVGADNVTCDPNSLKAGSKDCYWFSPVLKSELEEMSAEFIVRPETVEELKAIIKLAVAAGIPITPRGAGTGNYGQGIPLRGGIMVNTKRMNRILEIDAEKARAEAGVILLQIETEARKLGAEMRFFPSTMPTSTAAGFVAGGSGGIGSIEWGMLFDEGNVLSATVVTIEEEPRELELTSWAELTDVIHNCGLTAFLVDVTFALAPKTDWHQYVVSYPDIVSALKGAEHFAYDTSIKKRLVTAFEWPIPSYFTPLVKRGACPEGKAVLFLYLAEPPEVAAKWINETGGEPTLHIPPYERPRAGIEIYDFTWNHTTMWAIKADPSLTYLQDQFQRDRLYEQLALRKERFGDQVLLHAEFSKARGEVRPGALSIVRYESRDQLWEIIEFCESIGIRVANPHTHFLDDDVRWAGEHLLSAKNRWDPKGLLNPGHLRALEQAPAAAAGS